MTRGHVRLSGIYGPLSCQDPRASGFQWSRGREAHIHQGMQGPVLDMETDLQMQFCKMEGSWFFTPVPVVCLPLGFQSFQAIRGQLFSMECLCPLLVCSCWSIGRDSELLTG